MSLGEDHPLADRGMRKQPEFEERMAVGLGQIDFSQYLVDLGAGCDRDEP